MPHVKLDTPTGAIEIRYSIATPSTPSADHVAHHLPCILFIHAGWVGKEIFETQFEDPRLRSKFNLIALDMRGYGTTKGMINQEIYTPADAADDVYRFVKAIELGAIHVFGLSIGSSIALEFAAAHPDLVLSLTLCSPLPATEPEHILAGRLEIYDCWVNAFNHDGSCPTVEADQLFLNDLVLGAQQLCFNNERNTLVDALSELSLKIAIQNRAGTPDKLRFTYHLSVGIFENRRPLSGAVLSKIRCPIRLIHCQDDVAYGLQDAQEIEASLRHAGLVDVVLYEISAPHYGNVINPQAVNAILLDVALPTSYKTQHDRSPGPNPEGCQKMTTPFTDALASYGYDPFEQDESEFDCY